MDFTKWEELEKQEKELAEQLEEIKKQEDILKKLEEKIANTPSSQSSVRNLAVDASGQLKDDRGTDADQLYKDAAELDAALKNGQKSAIQEDAQDETVELPGKGGKKEEAKEYSGPSVLSYTLDGRKATHLPIPAYRCYGAGDVTVIITVNNAGQVVRAKVMEEISSTDNCLRSFAVRAARLSRFSADPNAPANQTGEIVYRFIAQ